MLLMNVIPVFRDVTRDPFNPENDYSKIDLHNMETLQVSSW